MALLDIIRAEARAHRTVTITASEADGSVETREIEPYSFRQGRDDALLFYHCLLRGATRSSKVHSIVGVQPTGRAFTPRWPVEL